MSQSHSWRLWILLRASSLYHSVTGLFHRPVPVNRHPICRRRYPPMIDRPMMAMMCLAGMAAAVPCRLGMGCQAGIYPDTRDRFGMVPRLPAARPDDIPNHDPLDFRITQVLRCPSTQNTEATHPPSEVPQMKVAVLHTFIDCYARGGSNVDRALSFRIAPAVEVLRITTQLTVVRLLFPDGLLSFTVFLWLFPGLARQRFASKLWPPEQASENKQLFDIGSSCTISKLFPRFAVCNYLPARPRWQSARPTRHRSLASFYASSTGRLQIVHPQHNCDAVSSFSTFAPAASSLQSHRSR